MRWLLKTKHQGRRLVEWWEEEGDKFELTNTTREPKLVLGITHPQNRVRAQLMVEHEDLLLQARYFFLPTELRPDGPDKRAAWLAEELRKILLEAGFILDEPQQTELEAKQAELF